MYLVSVIFRNTQQINQFHFDDFQAAERTLKKFAFLQSGITIEVSDEYGCMAHIRSDDVASAFLTNLEKELQAHESVEESKANSAVRVRNKMQQSGGLSLINPKGRGIQ